MDETVTSLKAEYNQRLTVNVLIASLSISIKPLVWVAGMKKLEFEAAGLGDASPNGCLGSDIASLGSFSMVMRCFLRLKNTSAPLNVG